MIMKEKEKLNYKNIKKVLRKHIELGINSLWTWNRNYDGKGGENFTHLYKTINEELQIYSCRQLLELLENE